ncbi:prepilin-type N-terminal cleavage/methylation domain-containing protein [Patescibacteria group bacterium]|nr:prepilin-type N-terminal cleavage/methylation domain-containing protein [Patescibacteria group bacterium]
MGKHHAKSRKAFTLIELIIVIAIIAILAAAIFVAIDPARRLHEARNARRRSDVVTILEAVKKHQVDNEGALFSSLESATAGVYYMIGSGCSYGEPVGFCGAATVEGDCMDITQVGSGYLADLPYDPLTGSASGTDYYIMKGTHNEVYVGACDPEGEGAGGTGTAPTIDVAR